MRLKLKKRINLIGYKESYPVVPFEIGARLNLSTVKQVFSNEQLPHNLRVDLVNLELALLNCYQRKYYLSGDGCYRLTVDWDIAFWRLSQHKNLFMGKVRDPSLIVVELKYIEDNDHSVHHVSNYFPFRVSRNSKCVAGVMAVS